MNWLVSKLIAFAKRTPFTHLHHGDGSVYMERYWLLPYNRYLPFAIRLHWIATPDYDRHLHDHPWSFLSLILRGKYIELRPIDRSPCFDGEQEATYATYRTAGSIAFRWWSDRHRISWLSPGGAWTLFISFQKMHWWGFYTPEGKVYYRDYQSVHNATESHP